MGKGGRGACVSNFTTGSSDRQLDFLLTGRDLEKDLNAGELLEQRTVFQRDVRGLAGHRIENEPVAFEAARADDSFWSIWTASTRLERLVAKGDVPYDGFVSAGDPGEDALNAARVAAEGAITAGREAQDVAQALAALGPFAAAVDQFFTDVLVNDGDPKVRARRYALVDASAHAFRQVADFTKITDQGGAR